MEYYLVLLDGTNLKDAISYAKQMDVHQGRGV